MSRGINISFSNHTIAGYIPGSRQYKNIAKTALPSVFLSMPSPPKTSLSILTSNVSFRSCF